MGYTSCCDKVVGLGHHLPGQGYLEKIQMRYHLRTGNGNDRSDIYDGVVYQEQMASGFLSNQSNILFILNTDGVPVFRSSSFSFWPIYLIINELPYKMRYACLCY